ncbi:dienelactone hydrolase family protein [Shewanella sp. 1_MG-2023]|uniref:alpha/beta family hydrolase n=1 Tax=unclassified Shewanella TaxID=196818 RepID=UPI0026E4064E|nr:MULTISPECIES: alpha/beta family hydrolase [unclassified Shewanella]MDO6612536.1 dienelactone hydrolase family protein [Shewanella sp. 7_MG-2023]MDO6772423.1 dienelactone hydrolase family protein [Shewanella sp. 2_MG-2023]MDO6794579.1 dienelactone hydrolase family protein [Shewanella sp. 1_MG-2023]
MTKLENRLTPVPEIDIETILLGKPSKTLVVFAHGAGANMHSDFMEQVANDLAQTGVQVLRFNFLYMQANMQDGKRRPPDRAPKLLNYYQQVLVDIEHQIKQGNLITENIILMGKSMGGRMSAIITTPELSDIAKVEIHPEFEQVKKRIKAVMCLGYPFVPLKGGEPRLSPINDASVPVMVLQGERDKFGGKTEIPLWPLSDAIKLGWITDGDHSFMPRKSSGATLEANLQDCIEQCKQFIDLHV